MLLVYCRQGLSGLVIVTNEPVEWHCTVLVVAGVKCLPYVTHWRAISLGKKRISIEIVLQVFLTVYLIKDSYLNNVYNYTYVCYFAIDNKFLVCRYRCRYFAFYRRTLTVHQVSTFCPSLSKMLGASSFSLSFQINMFPSVNKHKLSACHRKKNNIHIIGKKQLDWISPSVFCCSKTHHHQQKLKTVQWWKSERY